MTSCVGFGAGGDCTSSAGSGEVGAFGAAASVGVGGEQNGEGTARGCGITGI